VEVDPDVPVEIAQASWCVERLHTTDILCLVGTRQYPPVIRRRVGLCDLHRKLFEYPTKKLEVRELHSVDSNILAQLYNHKLLLLA
jgi:hypothetical protein